MAAIIGALPIRQYAIVALCYVAFNLIVHQITGVALVYWWYYKNRRNLVINASPEMRAVFKDIYRVATDKELERHGIKPKVFLVLLHSYIGKNIVRDFFIDGPHTAVAGFQGLIKDRRLFEFAVKVFEIKEIEKSDIKELFAPKLRKYTLIWMALPFFTVPLWGFSPYLSKTHSHFRAVYEFVKGFSFVQADTLYNMGRAEDVEYIKKLQDEVMGKEA